MIPIADQHAMIAARLKELAPEPVMTAVVVAPKVDVCPTCEDGGWIEVYSPHPPQFDKCPRCLNPHGHPSP